MGDINLYNLKIVDYEDEDGFLWKVAIPQDADIEDADKGIVLGPPELTPLELPKPIELRLNNTLFRRGLIQKKNLRGREQEVMAALQFALGVDITTIMNLYK